MYTDVESAHTMTHLMTTYTRQPVAFTRGEGVWLYDSTGKRYLDALAGIAVNTLGHAHRALVRALSDQAARVIHVSNLFEVPEQERAAELVCDITGLDEVFFCNSGCEANEAAIKLARLYGRQKGVREPHVLVMENAFHGRTLATLSATGNRKVQSGFEPLVPGFVRVPLNDMNAVHAAAERDGEIVAVLVEPIQGEAGIQIAHLEYLKRLRGVCEDKGWLFMADEVQCGLARTGKWFVYQHAGFLPDVVSLAKGLGSGFPVGACVAGGRAKGVFKPGNHGSTFGGNPLAMAAVAATITTIRDDALLANTERMGRRIREGLEARLSGIEGVREIRGLGLMLGVELSRPCKELVAAALERGLVINVTHERVIRLLPALIIGEAEAAHLVDVLSALVSEFVGSSAG